MSKPNHTQENMQHIIESYHDYCGDVIQYLAGIPLSNVKAIVSMAKNVRFNLRQLGYITDGGNDD